MTLNTRISVSGTGTVPRLLAGWLADTEGYALCTQAESTYQVQVLVQDVRGVHVETREPGRLVVTVPQAATSRQLQLLARQIYRGILGMGHSPAPAASAN